MSARAILEIQWGPMGYQKTVLTTGQMLRVGRSERADLSVPHDPQMSAVHFALAWDGARCTVRDLGSARGTRLGGSPVEEIEVPHGGWLQAGDTDFLLHIEAHSPPRREDAAIAATMMDEKAAAIASLRAERAPLFAVIDVSRGDRVLQLVRESIDEHRSLYEGSQGDALATVAPYLVALHPDSRLLERLVHEGWGRRWGIWLASAQPFRDVRRHLRRFLVALDDVTAKKFYFRFYDPFVLRVFLPTCTPRQQEDFFGEIESFVAETEHAAVARFARDDAAPP